MNFNFFFPKTGLTAILFCLFAAPAFAQWTNSAGHAYLTNTAKNVGIGNTSPLSRLHITGSNNMMRLQATGSTGYLSFYSNSSDYVGYAGIFNGAKNLEFGTGSGNTTGNLHLVTQSLPRLVITPGGNVGIGGGISNPKYKLFVFENTNDTTAMFTNTFTMGDKTVVLGATVVPTGASTGNAVAVKGVANVNPTSGIGGQFEGGLFSGHFSNGELFARAKNGIHSLHVEGQNAEAAYFTASGGHGISVWATGAGYYAGHFVGNVHATGVFTSSDARLKKDIQPLRGMMAKIGQLRPASYDFDTDEFDFLNLPTERQIGLLAQELEQVFPEMVREVKSAEHRCGNGCEHGHSQDGFTYKAVNYQALVPVLIAGMQEQQADIAEKDRKIADLETRISRLEKLVANLASADDRSISPDNSSKSEIGAIRPNPSNGLATVDFEIDPKIRQAELVIFDPTGRQIHRISIENRGKGSLEISLAGQPSGNYGCSILADGQAIAMRQLTLVR